MRLPLRQHGATSRPLFTIDLRLFLLSPHPMTTLPQPPVCLDTMDFELSYMYAWDEVNDLADKFLKKSAGVRKFMPSQGDSDERAFAGGFDLWQVHNLKSQQERQQQAAEGQLRSSGRQAAAKDPPLDVEGLTGSISASVHKLAAKLRRPIEDILQQLQLMDVDVVWLRRKFGRGTRDGKGGL